MISILHPTRSRPEKSVQTVDKWLDSTTSDTLFQLIVSVDDDDPKLDLYKQAYNNGLSLIINKNRSCVEAINKAAEISRGDILIVVSDDTDCFPGWDTALLKEVEGKTDWILKTQDGIQPWIITFPIMDRAYYNRYKYIYHPWFLHMFCDTYMTAVADINGRKLTSNLMFKHNHPGHGHGVPDELNKRNDATWNQGRDAFYKADGGIFTGRS